MNHRHHHHQGEVATKTLNNIFLCIPLALTLALPLLAFPHNTNAGDLEHAFEQLKDSGEDYRPAGAVCEQVARLDLQRSYPQAQYEVVTGIAYAHDRQVLGELDVVVFDRKSHRAVLFSEVKCWKNLKSALQKARKQRERFQKWVASDSVLKFYPAKAAPSAPSPYQQDQFEDTAVKFISISQEGGRAAGFDLTIDYSLEEMKHLRQRLLDCQAQSRCKRPDYNR